MWPACGNNTLSGFETDTSRPLTATSSVSPFFSDITRLVPSCPAVRLAGRTGRARGASATAIHSTNR